MRDSGNREIERPPQQDSEKAHPGPKRDHRKLRRGVLISMSIAIIVLLISFAALYFLVGGLKPIAPCCPRGSFSEVEPVSPTTAVASFAKFDFRDPSPTNLYIVLETSAEVGIYHIPNDSDGTVLILEDGEDVGTIVYLDFLDNGKVNEGDKLLLTDLDPGSEYTVRLCYIDGSIMDFKDFSTPSG